MSEAIIDMKKEQSKSPRSATRTPDADEDFGPAIPSASTKSLASLQRAAAADQDPVSANGPDSPQTLAIFLKDQQVTETKDVWVGQFISLVAKTDPAGGNIKEPKWTVAGKIVAGYKVIPSTEGVVTAAKSSDLENSSILFHWVDKGTKAVSFKGKINGVAAEVKVTFNVKAPDVSIVVTANDEPKMLNVADSPNLMQLFKSFGLDRHGQSQEGKFAWVQIGNIMGTLIYDTEYNQGAGITAGGQGLDGGFPYPGDPAMVDNPTIPFDSRVTLSAWRQDSFKTWLMFQHKEQGSIWVPLKIVEWYWWANASRAGETKTWTLDSFGYEEEPTAVDTSTFPVWDEVIPDPIQYKPLGQ